MLLGGATASGKTALALALAERFAAEIIGADSRQIYRGMPVGTAAPDAAMLARVPHHLIGFLDPAQRYSAARFAHDALGIIATIRSRGGRAIVAGGTGFYLRALAGDVRLDATRDAALRERLAREADLHPPEALHEWLAVLAPERAAALAPNDRYRVLRALEIALGERGPRRAPAAPDAFPQPASLRAAGIAFGKFVLVAGDEQLEARIERRVDAMLSGGLLDEAERLGATAVAADAVGYPQALAYLAGHATFPELRISLIRATRRYAKRQRTWFRSEPGVRFIAPEDALETVSSFARDELGW